MNGEKAEPEKLFLSFQSMEFISTKDIRKNKQETTLRGFYQALRFQKITAIKRNTSNMLKSTKSCIYIYICILLEDERESDS